MLKGNFSLTISLKFTGYVQVELDDEFHLNLLRGKGVLKEVSSLISPISSSGYKVLGFLHKKKTNFKRATFSHSIHYIKEHKDENLLNYQFKWVKNGKFMQQTRKKRENLSLVFSFFTKQHNLLGLILPVKVSSTALSKWRKNGKLFFCGRVLEISRFIYLG